MKKIVLAAAAIMLAAFAAFAAPPADNVASTPTPPTGACRDAAPLVLSRSNGHLYGCVSGAWHDWTAAMLAGISGNSIVGDVTIDGSLAATGSLTASSFKGEVDLTTDPSYPAGLIRDGQGFQARTNGGGYVKLAPGALEAGSLAGDVNLHAPYGAVRVEGSALAPLHGGGTVDLGTAVDPFKTVYASGVDLDGDGTLDLGAAGKGIFLHGTADAASMLGGYYPSDFALASALAGYVPTSQKGAANGVAALDSDGKVPSAQLPPSAPMTTKGDLYGYDGSAGARVPAGGDGSVLVADSTQPAGLAYRSVDWIQRGTVDGVPAGLLPQSDEFNGTSLDSKWSVQSSTQATITFSQGTIVLYNPTYDGTNPVQLVRQSSVPSGDFAIVVKATSVWNSGGSYSYGKVIVAYASGPTAADSVALWCDAHYSNDMEFGTGQVEGTNNPVLTPGTGGGACGAGWYALEYIGNVVKGYRSSDGLNWSQIGAAVTVANRPTKIGFGVYAGQNAYGPYPGYLGLDYWRVAPAKNTFGVTAWYVNTFTGPFSFTGSDVRANDTASREGVFAANGPVKLWSDQNNDAPADRHVRVYHGNKISPQVDYDGSTNTEKLDLDSDGTVDYVIAKPAAACASGMEMAVNASGQVVCKTRSPIVLFPPLGSCDNGGNYSRGAWSSTGAAAVGCEDVRGFYKHPYFEYPDGSSNVMAYSFLAPDNWDGTLTITLWWSGSQTSGAVRWFESHDCFASGSTFYSQPTTTATVVSTAAGTASKQTAVALSVTGLSSCAGGMTTILVGRDGANDTYTGSVQVNGIKIALGAK